MQLQVVRQQPVPRSDFVQQLDLEAEEEEEEEEEAMHGLHLCFLKPCVCM